VKRKPWKIVLGMTGTMVLVLGLLAGDAHRRAAATLAWYRADLEKRTAEFRARDPARPSPAGEGLEGNAWDHYGPALKAIADVPDELADLVPEIEGVVDPEEKPPDDHALHNLFREYSRPLEDLERGTRCRTVKPPGISFEPSASIPASEALRTEKWMAGIISHSHRMGLEREGLAAARTALAFSQDFGRSGLLIHSLIQCVGESITTFALQDVLSSHGISVPELVAFADALDRLAAGRPDFLDCWPGEVIYAEQQLLNLPWEAFDNSGFSLGSPPRRTRLPSWRCLFSREITRAQALGLLIPRLTQAMALRGLPPWERVAAAPPHSKDSESVGNLMADALSVSVWNVVHRDAVTLLGRVLLRVSVAIAWYEGERGRYPERLEDLVPRFLSKVPVCPLTGLPLRYQGGKVWSVGKNRVDDGGTPDPQDLEEGGTGDVVWRLGRRK